VTRVHGLFLIARAVQITCSLRHAHRQSVVRLHAVRGGEPSALKAVCDHVGASDPLLS
jgi:hypothetical protein